MVLDDLRLNQQSTTLQVNTLTFTSPKIFCENCYACPGLCGTYFSTKQTSYISINLLQTIGCRQLQTYVIIYVGLLQVCCWLVRCKLAATNICASSSGSLQIVSKYAWLHKWQTRPLNILKNSYIIFILYWFYLRSNIALIG